MAFHFRAVSRSIVTLARLAKVYAPQAGASSSLPVQIVPPRGISYCQNEQKASCLGVES